MTNEKTYQNLKEWYNNQPKEVQYACGIAIVAALTFFAASIDSLVDAGVVGFICGTLWCCIIGLIIALAFLVIYWIAAAFRPKKAEKVLDALTSDPEDTDLN